jgi:hypothetical protein
LIYLKKHLVDEQEKSFTITVDEKPLKAGIDPIFKLIDRNPEDNIKELEAQESL